MAAYVAINTTNSGPNYTTSRDATMRGIKKFSRVTGLDRRTADALVRERKVEGLRHTDGRVFGIFDDALPTRGQLRSLGLNVRDDYDPALHRSYTVATDDDPEPVSGEDEPERWTVSWDDAES